MQSTACDNNLLADGELLIDVKCDLVRTCICVVFPTFSHAIILRVSAEAGQSMNREYPSDQVDSGLQRIVKVDLGINMLVARRSAFHDCHGAGSQSDTATIDQRAFRKRCVLQNAAQLTKDRACLV